MTMIALQTPAYNSRPAGVGSFVPEKDPVERAVAMIERCLREPANTDQLAEHVGISPRQLQRLFKAKLGRAPRDYCREVRLHRAFWLLQKTGKPVGEIATLCGFRHTAHFCRQFKKYFGRSALQARYASEG